MHMQTIIATVMQMQGMVSKVAALWPAHLTGFVLAVQRIQQVNGEHGEKGVHEQQRHSCSETCLSYCVWQCQHDLPNLQSAKQRSEHQHKLLQDDKLCRLGRRHRACYCLLSDLHKFTRNHAQVHVQQYAAAGNNRCKGHITQQSRSAPKSQQ